MEVIVIEDESVSVEVFRRALKAYPGAHMQVFANGASVLEHLGRDFDSTDQKESPKIVFLDLTLPDIPGLEVLVKIRKNPLTRATPVIVFSGSEDHALMKRSYESGANSYLLKPVSYDDFRNLIEIALRFWLEMNQVPGR